MGEGEIMKEKMKYDLDIQLFGDGVMTFDEILEDKLYQAEFDRRVTKAVSTVQSKLEAMELNYSKLVETHEEYKNNNSSDKYKELETKYNELNKELNGAKNKTLLTNKNVNEDYLDFVDFNVSQMVNDELTYEQALETFAKDNERYFQKSKTVSTQHQTKNDKIDVASFNDVIRSNFNKK